MTDFEVNCSLGSPLKPVGTTEETDEAIAEVNNVGSPMTCADSSQVEGTALNHLSEHNQQSVCNGFIQSTNVRAIISSTNLFGSKVDVKEGPLEHVLVEDKSDNTASDSNLTEDGVLKISGLLSTSFQNMHDESVTDNNSSFITASQCSEQTREKSECTIVLPVTPQNVIGLPAETVLERAPLTQTSMLVDSVISQQTDDSIKTREVVKPVEMDTLMTQTTGGMDTLLTKTTGDGEMGKGRKRSRQIGHSEVEIMDHSGLQHEPKKTKETYKDGVMLCLPLSSQCVKDGSPEEVSRELARCLHESKHILLGEVVRVFGVEKTLGIFRQTAAIQETGGQLVTDGNKKKAPGGVFFTLVKQAATVDEKEEIFRKDKIISDKKKKHAKRRKFLEKERREKERERKAQWQFKVFKSQLANPDAPYPSLSEWDCSLDERIEKNVQKQRHTNKEGSSRNPGTEAMDVDTQKYRKQLDRRNLRSSRPLSTKIDSSQLNEEKQAAETFEQMNDCQLDFGLDLD